MMQTFKDKENFEWRVDLTLGDVKRIEAFDFAEALGAAEPTTIRFFPPQDNLFTEMITNPAACFAMVWCCVEDQAHAAGVANMYEFAKRLKGEHINAAREAFYGELPDFFPEMATTLRALIDSYSNVSRLTNKKMSEAVTATVDMELLERKLDREVAAVTARARREMQEMMDE